MFQKDIDSNQKGFVSGIQGWSNPERLRTVRTSDHVVSFDLVPRVQANAIR